MESKKLQKKVAYLKKVNTKCDDKKYIYVFLIFSCTIYQAKTEKQNKNKNINVENIFFQKQLQNLELFERFFLCF